MRKKIAIIGSTGSIGKSLLKVISKDKKKFEIVLLTANKNYKELINQIKKFEVKNVIISDDNSYKKFIKKNRNNKIKIYNNFDNYNKIFNKKVDYVMSSIVGLEGLKPTLNIIKYTKKIAIANKESIICAWNLINKELKKNKTNFIPVDSEHFSTWYAIKNNSIKNIEKIYLTASGGPLLKVKTSEFDNIKIEKILKHPNWRMGKKISVDSSTMMNKVFEIIEAKKIFNINYEKLSILIHPNSYLHSVVKFNNGMIKMIAHDTTMDIPIFNTIYTDTNNTFKSKKIDLYKFNNLQLSLVDYKKFPLINVLNNLPDKNSLFETVLVSANDELVRLFLANKIKFSEISQKLLKIINFKEFKKMKNIYPKKVYDVIKLSKLVRLKINSTSI